MMNAQLLLLLALVGPLCAFTLPNPTITWTSKAFTEIIFDPSEVPEDSTVVINPTTEEPGVTPEEVTTEAVTASPSAAGGTEEPDSQTDATIVATTPLQEVHQTDPPVVATTQAEEEVHTTAMSATEAWPTDKVLLVEEAGTSGTVVGIVIGALLAVVFVIAVVIAVVRRMGKYSP